MGKQQYFVDVCMTKSLLKLKPNHKVTDIDETRFEYLVYGWELGSIEGDKPNERYPHLQIFGRLKVKSTIETIQRIPGLKGVHIEAKYRNSTFKEASDYCKKEGPEYYWEYGTLPEESRAGQRTDLIVLCDELLRTRDLKALALRQPDAYVRNYRGLASLLDITGNKQRTWKTEVHIYMGSSGHGKTIAAETWLGKDYFDVAVTSKGQSQWYGGYTGQESVFIDEFEEGRIPINEMKRLMDQCKHKVPIKGTEVEWIPKKLAICSNVLPSLWYKEENPESRKAFKDRITKVYNCTRTLCSFCIDDFDRYCTRGCIWHEPIEMNKNNII